MLVLVLVLVLVLLLVLVLVLMLVRRWLAPRWLVRTMSASGGSSLGTPARLLPSSPPSATATGSSWP